MSAPPIRWTYQPEQQQSATQGTSWPSFQTELDIPDDVFARLLTGEYVRDGGVVRDLAGRLVKLLDDASPVADAQEAARASIAKALTHPKSVAIGLGVVAVAASAGGVAFLTARKKKAAKPELPTCVENYNASLTAYLETARNGNLDAGIIDRLIADLDAVMEESDSSKITIDFSPEQSETLVGIVADYTRNLAGANQLELSDLQQQAPDSESGAIIDLRRYLEIQGRIFDGAA